MFLVDGARTGCWGGTLVVRLGWFYLTIGAGTYIVWGGAGALWAWAARIGAIAQLGERYNGIVEVKGSSPFSSTRPEGGRVFVRA